MEQIRLQKFLANSGICSRRKEEEYILAEKVEVNGTENFYITDNADLVIVYPPYAVAPYAAGTIEFIIPVSQVADIFNFKLE